MCRYESGIEIHGTLQIPFLKIRARIDLSLKLKPKFKLDAAVYLDPIIYLDGLLKIVHADSDDKGAYLKMFLTETLTELRIEGSCRVTSFENLQQARVCGTVVAVSDAFST